MPANKWLFGTVLLLIAGSAAAAEDEAPPAELLEFIGEFAGSDGKWIDPTALDTPVPAKEPVQEGGKRDEP